MKKRREEAKKRSKAEAPELNSAAGHPRDTFPGSCNASAEEASPQSFVDSGLPCPLGYCHTSEWCGFWASESQYTFPSKQDNNNHYSITLKMSKEMYCIRHLYICETIYG